MAIETAGATYAHILDENRRYADQFDRSKLPAQPARGLAVLACMDARLVVEEALGLRTGDANIIRNAGGLASDDAIRSLIVSQELLGTEEVIVIGHTGCGMASFRDEAVGRALAERSGVQVDLPLGSFDDVERSVREQVARIRAHPWTKDVPVHGLIFETETGRMREVVQAGGHAKRNRRAR
jgi:carbonic anhydrase